MQKSFGSFLKYFTPSQSVEVSFRIHVKCLVNLKIHSSKIVIPTRSIRTNPRISNFDICSCLISNLCLSKIARRCPLLCFSGQKKNIYKLSMKFERECFCRRIRLLHRLCSWNLRFPSSSFVEELYSMCSTPFPVASPGFFPGWTGSAT